jgi:UDP-galactopyranose mutase
VNWLMRFGEFVPYEHRVQARLENGRCVPLPVNRQTINTVFGVKLHTEEQTREFLRSQAVRGSSPRNAAEYLYANIGKVLTELFFRPYTRKMWALDLEDMDASVVKRLPVRFDDEDRYFPSDRLQLLPRHGYTRVFETMLDHENIRVTLGQPFDRARQSGYVHCFNSMPIDEYYDTVFGPLPYRSIRFHNVARSSADVSGTASVTNFTDNGPLTRESDWTLMPYHRVITKDVKTITREELCDYRDNNFERYYPVKTSDGRYEDIYKSYKSVASAGGNVTFIARCGTYQYLDMHQVINQSLKNVRTWIDGMQFN